MYFPGHLGRPVIWFLLVTVSILINCHPHPNVTSMELVAKSLKDEDCQIVPVDDAYSDPCLSYFGVDTYQVCPSTCQYGSCKCCRDGRGCPPPTDEDQCKFAPEIDGDDDPCISYFGSSTYKYCGSPCQYGSCKCCRDYIGCPKVEWPNLALCKFVPEHTYFADPCTSYLGDDTYELCVYGCRESKCLCCEDGKGCPTHQV